MGLKVSTRAPYWPEKSGHVLHTGLKSLATKTRESPISGLILSSRSSPWCVTVVF